jgi:putative Holliday junction resolvase
MVKNSDASQRKYRILALDLGEKRIGVALSDETQTIARSYTVFQRSSRSADFRTIGQIIKENNVELVIVGLPTLPSGEEGSKAAWARNYGQDLATQSQVKVELWDESLSTVDAIDSLRDRGVIGRRQRKRVDAVAAAFILQSFLDAVDNPQNQSL